MTSFPSHGCYTVNGVRTHPRTLEVETKDNPLPASFYDVDISFKGLVKYYTDPPQEDWWAGFAFDCVRQLRFHQFAVRALTGSWRLIDVDKRTVTWMSLGREDLPLTKRCWLKGNIIMPHRFIVDNSTREIAERACFPCENGIFTDYLFVDRWEFSGDATTMHVRFSDKLGGNYVGASCLSGEDDETGNRDTISVHAPYTHLYPYYTVEKLKNPKGMPTIIDFSYFKLPIGVSQTKDFFIANDGITVGTTRILFSQMVGRKTHEGEVIADEIEKALCEADRDREIIETPVKRGWKCPMM